MLSIENLQVSINNKYILTGINFNLQAGEVHAIMGPNGSGKSTLSSILAGRENYTINTGKILFKGLNLLSLKPEERAGEGIFVSFQYPIEIPGVSNQFFLQNAINSIRKYRNLPSLDRFDLINLINSKLKLLKISSNLLNRSVNYEFSGGEKKRNEILQMILLDPILIILDEIDSGLDIDALKIVIDIINDFRDKNKSFIIITHYQKILTYIKPDLIHIILKGKIIKSGNYSLVKILEEKGYDWFRTK